MAALGHIDYPQDNIKINNRVVPMRLQREGGCANLAAIHNMLRIKGYRQWETTVLSEHLIMRDLKDKLEEIILSIKDIPPAEADEAKNTLANVRTLFCLKPCLTGHLEFEKNGSRLLCELLNLPVLHAWVLDPQEESYDVFCHYSHSDLADYFIEDIGDHLDVCQRLLAKNFTSFGFKTLLEELNDDSGTALLFRGNRLDVICKHDSAIFIYVVEQTIREKIKGAVWMLFEEDEEQRIYFTDKFTPVKVQPHREKAMKWYGDLLKKSKDIEDEKRKKSSQHMLSDAAAGSSIPGEATGKRADAVGSHHGDGGAVVSRQDRVKKSPQQAHTVSAQSSESSTEILTTGKGAEAVGSHHGDGGPVVSHQDRVKKSPQQAHTLAAQSPSTEILTTGKGAEAVGSHQGDGGEVTQSDDAGGSSSPSEASGKRAEAVDSHQGHGEVVVFPEDNTVKKPPQQAHSADGAAETSKSTTAEEDRRPEADNISGSQDHVLKGDASDFLNFLDEFKDNGCSDHYFKGVVAAFASQRPMFYVPFDFIMSFNEPLALKIEHNYSGICEDLKKAVDIYLTKNGVESPDAILKILGRPQAKSVSIMEIIYNMDQ